MSPLASTTLRVGDSAPHLVLPTRDGESVDLSSILDLGAVLLVFVPGTWSPTTRRQLEELEHAHERYLQVGIAVVVVATQDRGRIAKALLHSSPSFLILSDGDREAARNFGVYRAISWDGLSITLPAIFLIDRDRSVKFMYVGQKDSDVPDTETILQLASWLVGIPEAPEEAEEPIAVADDATVEFAPVPAEESSLRDEDLEEPVEAELETAEESEAAAAEEVAEEAPVGAAEMNGEGPPAAVPVEAETIDAVDASHADETPESESESVAEENGAERDPEFDSTTAEKAAITGSGAP